jgi:predicted small lipoprotein YifL
VCYDCERVPKCDVRHRFYFDQGKNTMRPGKLLATIGLALLVAALTACGYKGPLKLPEPPPTTDQNKKS